MNTEIDAICRKLRLTVAEYGQDAVAMDEVVIITTLHNERIGGHKCVQVPTISEATLGNCRFEVARFFENS